MINFNLKVIFTINKKVHRFIYFFLFLLWLNRNKLWYNYTKREFRHLAISLGKPTEFQMALPRTSVLVSIKVIQWYYIYRIFLVSLPQTTQYFFLQLSNVLWLFSSVFIHPHDKTGPRRRGRGLLYSTHHNAPSLFGRKTCDERVSPRARVSILYRRYHGEWNIRRVTRIGRQSATFFRIFFFSLIESTRLRTYVIVRIVIYDAGPKRAE